MVMLACGPMMHGGSQWILGNAHVSGATVALYDQPNFSAEKILDLVQKAGVNSLTFLGDAMGRPVADAILAEPDRWDLSTLVAVSNGAAPLSEGVRAQIREALPGRFILDTYGASESGATASRIDDGTEAAVGRAQVRRRCRRRGVRRGHEAVPGRRRRHARPLAARCPLGYYKDPVKTAATFKEIDGVRWSIPGDFGAARGGRLDHRPGSRLGLASTPAARRSTPRRSRRSCSATTTCSTSPSSAPRTSAGASRSPPWCSAATAPTVTEDELARLRRAP